MCLFFFFKQKTAYEMRISDWSSDVCSSDLSRRKPYAVQLADGMELPVKQRATPGGVVERALGLTVEHFDHRTPNGLLRARAEFLVALSVLMRDRKSVV